MEKKESITNMLCKISHKHENLNKIMPLIKQASISGKLEIETVISVPEIMTEDLGYVATTSNNTGITRISWNNPGAPTFGHDLINKEYSARAMYKLYVRFEPVRKFIDEFTTQAVKAAKLGKTNCAVNIPERIDFGDLKLYLNKVLMDDKFEIHEDQLVLDWHQECDFI